PWRDSGDGFATLQAASFITQSCNPAPLPRIQRKSRSGKKIIFRYYGDTVRDLETPRLVLFTGITYLGERWNLHVFVDYRFPYLCPFSDLDPRENDAFADLSSSFDADPLAEHRVA